MPEPSEVQTTTDFLNKSSLLDTPEQKLTDKSTKYTYTPPEDDTIIAFGNFKSKKPLAWKWTPKNSASLVCRYAIPSDTKSDAAIFTIRQFDDNSLGDLQLHIQRWTSQFLAEDGRPIRPDVKNISVLDSGATKIIISGEYMGGSGILHQENRAMLIVVFEELDTTYFLKIFGQSDLVYENETELLLFLDSLELVPEDE